MKTLAPLPEPTDPQCEAALAFAKRWNLVCDNGEIVCMRDGCDLVATLPTLLCAEHLVARRRGWR
jgi:hypothetical protein